MEEFEISRISIDKEEQVKDVLTEEVPLTIYLDDKELVTLLASPVDLKELAVGFLFTSGLIKNQDEINSITVDEQKWTVHLDIKKKDIDSEVIFKRMFTSGCGRGTLFYKPADIMYRRKERQAITIDRKFIFEVMKQFQDCSDGYKETGCIHAAALVDSEKILVMKEDIGRHNAVDKILGHALMNNIDLKDKIMLSSGRISSEILLKMQKTDISVVISRSAPTNQAVKHARESGITLIGFVRGQRMNVYSGADNVQ